MPNQCDTNNDIILAAFQPDKAERQSKSFISDTQDINGIQNKSK